MSQITNRRARYDYELLKEFEAGVELYGFEVKALRAGKGNLAGSHVVVRAGEAFLVNASISPYQTLNTPDDYDVKRTRRLLLHKRELRELAEADDTKGLTIVPIAWHNARGRLKLKIAIAKGKKSYDKRETIKERDTKRQIERTLKGSE